MEASTNEFKKYQDIRHIAKNIVSYLRQPDSDSDYAIDEIENLAGAIMSKDMSGYATKGDIKEIHIKIDTVESKLLLKMDVFKRDIILWVLLGNFAIAQTPNFFSWLGKVSGKW